ncbi:MAG TPA: TRAFs-binding domain-containing protein [Candidatus Elarobacter sp.]|nr:TRAFs-binding domain-containing protein [Candidatus Elarobacter sp.]
MVVRPLVFVAMPFGTKPDSARTGTIDFDAIYEHGIKPALGALDVDFIRADEERTGGMIHVPMFARLLLAEVAVVDVTIDNANVFYELGVRHCAKPRSTIIVSGKNGPLPFDIANLRAIPYELVDGRLTDDGAAAFVTALRARVADAIAQGASDQDSPLFQLFANFPGVPVNPEDIDPAFKERALELQSVRDRLGSARSLGRDAGLAAVAALAANVVSPNGVEASLVMDVIFAYRALSAFDEIVAFVESLPDELRRKSFTVREQCALALNKRNGPGDRENAIKLLKALQAERSDPSSETAGLLGSVYKAQYFEALAGGRQILAANYLENAIDAYRDGFSADPRDYYPGINLLELLLVDGSDEAVAEIKRTLPAVAFAVTRLGGVKSSDYWVVATALELAILANDWSTAARAVPRMVGLTEDDKDHFRLGSTLANLDAIRARRPAGIDPAAFDEILTQLRENQPA